MVLTPTLEVQRLDLSTVEVVPLLRGRPIPAAQVNDCFIFDPIGVRDLSDARTAAKDMAELYGAQPLAARDEDDVWVITKPGHPQFGEIVDAAIMADGTRTALL
eukprot:9261844-Heterocapsa_arctica.AAC.1